MTPILAFGSRRTARRGNPIKLWLRRAKALEQKKTSPEEIIMKNVSVRAAERRGLSTHCHSVYATITAFTLLVCGGAYAQAGWPGGRARFEPASVAVPVGNTCVLHPEGNSDAAKSISVSADADGVARFQVVRPTRPDSRPAGARLHRFQWQPPDLFRRSSVGGDFRSAPVRPRACEPDVSAGTCARSAQLHPAGTDTGGLWAAPRPGSESGRVSEVARRGERAGVQTA